MIRLHIICRISYIPALLQSKILTDLSQSVTYWGLTLLSLIHEEKLKKVELKNIHNHISPETFTEK